MSVQNAPQKACTYSAQLFYDLNSFLGPLVLDPHINKIKGWEWKYCLWRLFRVGYSQRKQQVFYKLKAALIIFASS
jgi:hypothetical protein